MTSRGYKATVTGFLSVFLIFTIGIPVIVASCPMVKSPGKMTCSACLPSDGGTRASVAAERNTSCCRTVIVSGRNLIEYISIETALGSCQQKAGAHVVALPDSRLPAAVRSMVILRTPKPPPTAQGDIRLLVSSLLI